MEDQKGSKMENSDQAKVNEEVSEPNKEIDHDGETFESETVKNDEVVSTETKPHDAAAGDMIQASEEVVEVSSGPSYVPELEEEAEKVVSDSSSPVVKDLGAEPSLEKNEETALPISNTNTGESSEMDNSVPKGKIDSYGGVNQEMSEIPRSTETQPFVAVTPQPRTSWMNCCGLLDFLKRPSQ